jgi:hypothetical protein
MAKDPVTPGTPDNTTEDLGATVATLSDMRDQLALALTILEQNTGRINAWLRENHDTIIMARGVIAHAIARREEFDMWSGLGEIKSLQLRDEVLGFLLSDGALMKEAVDACGPDHDIVRRLKSVAPGLPARLIEELPQIDIDPAFDRRYSAKAVELARKKDAPVPQKPSGLTQWFKSKAEREAEENEALYRATLNKWQQVHRDLLGLQSDRHYYVDSFMDWVGENLSPDDGQKPEDVDAVMLHYQQPGYVLQLARQDYDDVRNRRARAVLDEAAAYAQLMQLLEGPNINAFAMALPALFPRPDSQSARRTRELVLRHYNANSFCHLALSRVDGAEKRLGLFRAVAAFEDRVVLDHVKDTPEQVLAQLVRMVCAKHEPLPPETLGVFMRTAQGMDARLQLFAGAYDIFGKINRYFLPDEGRQDPAGFIAAVEALTGDDKSARALAALRDALGRSDMTAAARVLERLDGQKEAFRLRALWDLCLPGVDMLQTIEGSTKDTGACLPVVRLVLTHRMAEQLTVEQAARFCDAALEEETPDTALIRLVLASVDWTPEATEAWRAALSGRYGTICHVTGYEDLDVTARLSLLAALLAPLPGHHQKAAALFDARAASGHGADANDLLDRAARILVEDPLKLAGDNYLLNAARAGNIWYHEDNGGMLYATMGGHALMLQSPVAEADADAILKILEHTAGFMPEHKGVFKTEGADRIDIADDGCHITFGRNRLPLQISSPMRREIWEDTASPMIRAKRGGEDGKSTFVMLNPDSLLAAVPLGDAWLVIDRAGKGEYLSDLRLSGNTGLTAAGKAYVNTHNAFLMTLRGETLELRIETHDFDAALAALAKTGTAQHLTDGSYLRLPLSGSEENARIRKAIDKNPSFLTPGGDYAGFYFNLSSLGFISFYDAAGECGIQHSQRGMNSPGRITIGQAGDAEYAAIRDGLLAAATDSPAALVMMTGTHVLIGTGNIQGVTYRPDGGTLDIVTDNNDLSYRMQPDAVEDVLKIIGAGRDWVRIEGDKGAYSVVRREKLNRIHHDDAQRTTRLTLGERVITLPQSAADFSAWHYSTFSTPRRAHSMAFENFRVGCADGYHPARQPMPPAYACGTEKERVALLTESRDQGGNSQKRKINPAYSIR